MAYTATLCIQLAGDISLETKRQPSRDRELSRQDRVQYILRMAGIWRNALSNSTKMCVVVRVPLATGNIQQVELRLWKEEKQSSMDETEIPPHQV